VGGDVIAFFDDDAVADEVVIPSIGEFTKAFSIVLSEAWARGKTVVVSESRALRSRVKGHGYIFSGYDARNLVEEVKEEKENGGENDGLYPCHIQAISSAALRM